MCQLAAGVQYDTGPYYGSVQAPCSQLSGWLFGPQESGRSASAYPGPRRPPPGTLGRLEPSSLVHIKSKVAQYFKDKPSRVSQAMNGAQTSIVPSITTRVYPSVET